MPFMKRTQEVRDMLETTEQGGDKHRTLLQLTTDRLARTGNVLKDVPLIGVTDNANGKSYSKDLLSNTETIKAYDKVKVFINHVDIDSGEHHGAQDLFGEISNVRYVERKDHLGLIGDITYNPMHPMADAFAWWYDEKPTVLGMSHDAIIVVDQQTKVVKSISRVDSVDIVYNPASTKSLRATEGIVQDKYNENKAAREIFDLANTGIDMFFTALWNNSTDEKRANECIKILDDLRQTLAKFQPKPQEGKTMEYKDITLDGIRQNRKDLLNTIETAAVEAYRATEAKVADAIKAVPDKLRTRLFVDGVRNAIIAGIDPKDIVSDQLSLAQEVKVETTPKSHGVAEQHTQEQKKEVKPFTLDDLIAAK